MECIILYKVRKDLMNSCVQRVKMSKRNDREKIDKK